MKRYQNISTVTTAVMKKSANGEFRNMTVKAGQIVHVSDEDIQMTKDSYNPRENNPFDCGFIAAIPEGKPSHPKAPKLGKNPTQKKAQEAVKLGAAAVKKMLENIADHRGLVIMRRALENERNALTDSQRSEIDRMIDRQMDKVERIQESNKEKFGAKA